MSALKASVAKPGDICILTEPLPDELPALRRRQKLLQEEYGGKIYDRIHLTCQRFRPESLNQLSEIIRELKESLLSIPSFPVVAESLMSFYAQFWNTHMVRWKILQTDSWNCFKSNVEQTLMKLSCPPHYLKGSVPTCSALEDVPAVSNQLSIRDDFPVTLFHARHVVFSEIKDNRQFKILAVLPLGERTAW